MVPGAVLNGTSPFGEYISARQALAGQSIATIRINNKE
jgi:hypothetical protein